MSNKVIEQEIDQIRLKIYEETRDMSFQELTEYYLKSGIKSAKKYGLKLVESAPQKMDTVISNLKTRA